MSSNIPVPGSTTLSPQRMVDLDRYPILDLDGAGRRLATDCRRQLDEVGACELPGFLRPQAVDACVAEAEALATVRYTTEGWGPAYLEIPDFALPEDHPRRILGRSAVGVVAYDQFPEHSLLRRLYEWDPLMEFIAAALAKPKLYRYADPLGALNLAVMGDGDELAWHFDQTDFVTSIALQPSAAGGEFEFAPLVRSATDENYPAVAGILRGGSELVRKIPMTPGTLLLFQGRYSIHRVTPVAGERTRHVALLAYDTKPGTCASELLQTVRYGRTARPHPAASCA